MRDTNVYGGAFNSLNKSFIMKSILVVIILFFSSISLGQEVKELSTIGKFVSNVGEIIRFEYYNLPDLMAYDNKITNKIRVKITGKEKGYFLIIRKKEKYDTKTIAISEDNLSDIINALDHLIRDSKNEKGGPDSVENVFKTKNGLQFGYAKAKIIVWFVALENNGTSTMILDGYDGLKSSLKSAQEKIKFLKQRY